MLWQLQYKEKSILDQKATMGVPMKVCRAIGTSRRLYSCFYNKIVVCRVTGTIRFQSTYRQNLQVLEQYIFEH